MSKKLFGRSIVAGVMSLGYSMTVSLLYIISSFYVAFQNATGFSGTQLGQLITVTGIASVILYIPGGIIGDRFPTKSLYLFGMSGTAVCAFVFAALPSFEIMLILHIVMAIMGNGIVWAVSNKAPRLLGTDEEQSTIFATRGVFTRIVQLAVSFTGIAFIAMMPTERGGMQVLLMMYAVIAILCVIITALFFKPVIEDTAKSKAVTFSDIKDVLKMSNVWLVGITGFGLYTASIGIVYIQPYLSSMYGMSTAISSTLGVITKQIGIAAAPFLGFLLAKKFNFLKYTSQLIVYSSVIAIACFGFYIIFPASPSLLIAAISISLLAAFVNTGAMNFQLVTLTESKVPVRLAASAIGITSMIAYSPDIFVYSIFGSWLDNLGAAGYTRIYSFCAVLLIVSFISAILVTKKIKAQIEAAAAESDS